METPLLGVDRKSVLHIPTRFHRRIITSLLAVSVLSVTLLVMQLHPFTNTYTMRTVLDESADGSLNTAPGGVGADSNTINTFVAWLPDTMRKMINTSVDPCQDFHAWACGEFDADTPIPKDKSSFAFSWDGDAKTITRELQAMMQTDQGKAGDYFRACLNSDLVEMRGLVPVLPWIALVDSVNDLDTLAIAVAKLHRAEVGNLFDWYLGGDDQHPTRELLMIDQGGLDLPDSSYYTVSSPRNTVHLQVYREYLASLFQLFGYQQPEIGTMVDDVLAIETELASHAGDDNDLRHSPRYNLPSFVAAFPNFKWQAYFAAMDHSDIAQDYDQISVASPLWLKALDTVVGTYPLQRLKNYIKSHLMFNVSPLLGKDFFAINLKMDSDLYGVSQHPKREEKCVGATKAALPFLVSKMFVDKYFPPAAKTKATTMLEHIRDAFREDLTTVAWMSPPSRAAAMDKLAKIFFEVGYPAVWPEYHFPVDPDSYFENSLESSIWRSTRKYLRLRFPVERHRWTMAPATVNAYYDNGVNGVFVPAGLLQSPFFDDSMPLAHNYGSSGAIMAHELTHGFDNSGRKYDAECRRRQWWDDATVAAFKSRANCLADVYNNFQIAGSHVHGNDTLGENIADIGGLKTAHRAYLEQEAKATSGGADDNHRKLFWTSFAQTWCSVERKRVTALNLLTDVHSPDKFRIMGPLQENAEFAKDFSCPVGSPMNPVTRCDLW